mmetsp:Transcript_35892/g.69359  ORF Transcript_35892/g.69359 Transcript_35892/m.69359 type:complete len:378 (+) Transcript_35892:2-1135(+)
MGVAWTHYGMGVACSSGQDLAFCRESSSYVPRMGVACAVCQIPARKDEDRYAAEMACVRTGSLKPLVGNFEADAGHVMCLGIYDGHGGKGVAELLKTKLHQEILKRECIPEATKVDKPASEEGKAPLVEEGKYEPEKTDRGQESCDTFSENAIKEAYRAIDGLSRVEHRFCGSTAINLFITNLPDGSRRVRCAWAGDSRAATFHRKSYKSFRELSSDHNLDREDEKERVMKHGKTLGGAVVARRRNRAGEPVGPFAVFSDHPDTNNLSLMMTRSIGDAMHSKAVIPDPEFKEFIVAKDEHVRIIMASDGLWRVVDYKTARKMLKSAPNPIRAANRLAIESVWRTQRKTHMKLDDVTVVVVDIVGSDSAMNETEKARP